MGRLPSFDWPLFLIGSILSVSGLVYLYSATWMAQDPPGPYFSPAVRGQLAYLAVAIILFFIARRVNWALKPDTWLWFYIPVLIPLIVVLFHGVGVETHGATRWISLGFFNFQPSEVAKAGYVLILAWCFSVEPARLPRGFTQAAAITCSLLLLVMLQPDLGTSLVFLFSFFIVAALTPLPRRTLLIALACLLLTSIPAWLLMRDYQKNRVLVFFGLEIAPQEEGGGLRKADPQGTAYHIKQSQIAVGSGGWTGKGFLRGTQTRGGFIPVIESDFIFALVGEEFGFFGCLYLIALYLLLLYRIVAIGLAARTDYERYLCYGISAVFLFHAIVAMGMTVRLTPITGLPLPFISRGGSALISMWLMLAVVQSVFTNSRRELLRR